MRKLVAYYFAPSGLFDKFILSRPISKTWKYRIDEVVACPDNKHIPRVAIAGQVVRGKQYLHNGLSIYIGSYYGPEIAQLLHANNGVHEPQEERVFQEVIASLKPGATMIELGSFWSFYSMWFQSVVNGARNFMIEPDSFNLGCGERNFRLNNLKGDFTQAFVGESTSTNGPVPVLCIDDFLKTKEISHLDLLHSDIQGFEFSMLKGAEKSIMEKRIGFIFISTHSDEVHEECLNFLLQKEFKIIANACKDDSFSEDGFIAASAPWNNWTTEIPISLKSQIKVNDKGLGE